MPATENTMDATVRPAAPAGELVELDFDYKVANDWVRDEMARTGLSVPDRYTLVLTLSDLDQRDRVRALALEAALLKEREGLNDQFFEELVPVLDEPSGDAQVILKAWERSIAESDRSAARRTEQREAAAREREQRTERAKEWIGVHGSQHLRRSLHHITKRELSFGLISGLYLRERAAEEMPGFVPAPAAFSEPFADNVLERSNPTEHELDALAQAAELAEEHGAYAELGWIPRKKALDAEGLEGVHGPVVLVTDYLDGRTLICPLDLSVDRQRFTRRLAMMVGSGIAPANALDVLSGNEPNVRFQQVLQKVAERVHGGEQLSEALEAEPVVFSSYYRSMVLCGEQSGTLPEALTQLADDDG